MNAQSTKTEPKSETPEVTKETPEQTQEANKDLVAEQPMEGEHLPRIREDMNLSQVKFPEIDEHGDKGELISLKVMFNRFRRHEQEKKSLSNTLGSFAVAVAESNKDLSPDAQANIFKALCKKGQDEVFPMIATLDDWGNVMLDGDNKPIMASTVPQSYLTMVSNMAGVWTGKDQKGNKKHDPVIPGSVYDVYDGRTKEFTRKLVSTLGQMKAVVNTQNKVKSLEKEKEVLKLACEATGRLVDEVHGSGFEDDQEIKPAIEKAIAQAANKEATSKDIIAANAEVVNLLGKRRAAKEARKEGGEDEATPQEKEQGEEITPQTDGETKETIPVDKKTGTVHLETLGLERHVSAADGFKLRHLGQLLANLEGEARKELSAALDVVINTTYQKNKGLEKKLEAWRREHKAA